MIILYALGMHRAVRGLASRLAFESRSVSPDCNADVIRLAIPTAAKRDLDHDMGAIHCTRDHGNRAKIVA